jgi:hypothetical protein
MCRGLRSSSDASRSGLQREDQDTDVAQVGVGDQRGAQLAG